KSCWSKFSAIRRYASHELPQVPGPLRQCEVLLGKPRLSRCPNTSFAEDTFEPMKVLRGRDFRATLGRWRLFCAASRSFLYRFAKSALRNFACLSPEGLHRPSLQSLPGSSR